MQRTVNPCRKTMWERYPPDQPYGTVAQLARASDCLSEGRGFEPHQSRHKMLLRLMARTTGSGPVNEGSSPSEAANFDY